MHTTVFLKSMGSTSYEFRIFLERFEVIFVKKNKKKQTFKHLGSQTEQTKSP